VNDQWFYGEDGQQRGPVSLAALRDRLASGVTRGDDLVWREGMANWAPAASVPELADAAPAAASGPPPITPAMQAGYGPTAGGYSHGPVGYAPPAYDFETARLTKEASSAMVFGIVALVTSVICCPLVGIGFGIAAIVKGRNARNAPNSGSALAGVICGSIAIALGVLSIVFGAAALPEAMRQARLQSRNGG